MLELWLHALAALAAGLGAVCRLLLDGALSTAVARRAGSGGSLPWGTIVVNLSGSLLIGLAAGALASTASHGGSFAVGSWQLGAALGFLGGYTTFSTASHQTVRLVHERRWGLALVNGLGQLLIAVALTGLGWWLGALLTG